MTQKPRESIRGVLGPVRHELGNALSQMVRDPNLAIAHALKGRDRMRCVGDLTGIDDLFPIVPDRPDLARRVVAIDIRSKEASIIHLRTAVDDSTGQ